MIGSHAFKERLEWVKNFFAGFVGIDNAKLIVGFMLAEVETNEYGLLHGCCYNWFLENIEHQNTYGCVSNRLVLKQGLGVIEFAYGWISLGRKQFDISWIDRFMVRRLKLRLEYESLDDTVMKSNLIVQTFSLDYKKREVRFVKADREAIMAQTFVQKLEGHLKSFVEDIEKKSAFLNDLFPTIQHE